MHDSRKDELREQIRAQNEILQKLMLKMNDQNRPQALQPRIDDNASGISYKELELREELRSLKDEIVQLQHGIQQNASNVYNPMHQMNPMNPMNPLYANPQNQLQGIQQMIKDALKEKYLEDRLRELQEKQFMPQPQQQQQPMYQPPPPYMYPPYYPPPHHPPPYAQPPYYPPPYEQPYPQPRRPDSDQQRQSPPYREPTKRRTAQPK